MHESQHLLQTEIRIGEGGQPLVEEGEDRLVFLAEDLGVIRIGGQPLDPEQQRVLRERMSASAAG